MAGASRRARGSATFRTRSSNPCRARSSAGGASAVATSDSTQARAAFAHLPFKPGEMVTAIMRVRFGTAPLLEAADVGHQALKLLGLQTLSVGGHLVLSLVDHLFEFRVALALHLRIGKARNAQVLAGRGVPFSGCT